MEQATGGGLCFRVRVNKPGVLWRLIDCPHLCLAPFQVRGSTFNWLLFLPLPNFKLFAGFINFEGKWRALHCKGIIFPSIPPLASPRPRVQYPSLGGQDLLKGHQEAGTFWSPLVREKGVLRICPRNFSLAHQLKKNFRHSCMSSQKNLGSPSMEEASKGGSRSQKGRDNKNRVRFFHVSY